MKKSAKPFKVRVKRLPHARGLPLPAYQTADAAGMDLVAALPKTEPIVLQPLGRALVPTGLVFELPPGSEAQIRPRSGLAAKHGITVLNSPGTIDADYRGEVSVILVNLSTTPFTISRGDRIAQMILSPVVQASLSETSALSRTERGSGGFGSTGRSHTRPKSKPAKNSRSTASGGRTKKSAKKMPRRSPAKNPANR